jgi:FKBP12-rapamycin complex-associated protein
MVPKPDVLAYYKLTPLQKLEVFQAALDGTSPFDLERAFYLNSKGSEDWLERRTTYTRSLAVISMVGYILGLGDRHPNNFLLSRNNGKIMHIDFGDCFEVAMQREKYAERVPFRLTRMLVAAMEVSGVQGTFRSTCQSVMRVLRANADSIIAVLEAFVYDPLINWRLIPQNNESGVNFEPTPALGLAREPTIPLDEYLHDDTLGSVAAGGGVLGVDEATAAANLMAPATEPLAFAGLENEVGDMHEALNAKAISVIQRVSNKLSGTDFAGKGTLDESTQVDLLFEQATNTENLATAFLGFCGYW